MEAEIRAGGDTTRLQRMPRQPRVRTVRQLPLGSAAHTLLMVAMLACPWITSPVGAVTPAGSEFHINTHTTAQQTLPALAVSNGSFVVTWMSNGQDGSFYGIFGQRYDSTGSAVGTEFQVNSYTTFNQRYPDVAGAANGDLIVV